MKNFSDALYEIADSRGKMLGVDRLLSIFQECGWPQANVDFKEIEKHLLLFSNLIRFKDDFTLLDIGMVDRKS